MTSLTHCFDDGVRYSFDVILFIHKEFSTSPVFLGTAELKWKEQFVGSQLSIQPAGLQVLSLVLLSQPSLWLSAAFLQVLLHLFAHARDLKKILVPLYMHSDHSKPHFLSQTAFVKPCILGNHSYCFRNLILHRFHCFWHSFYMKSGCYALELQEFI